MVFFCFGIWHCNGLALPRLCATLLLKEKDHFCTVWLRFAAFFHFETDLNLPQTKHGTKPAPNASHPSDQA
ncbi:hypothetical protein HK27_04605 [Acetobacter orientalis]|nr:hypothetical protein HK27_04605 [Acetobacter orientalis]